jgi:hypothetical protein
MVSIFFEVEYYELSRVFRRFTREKRINRDSEYVKLYQLRWVKVKFSLFRLHCDDVFEESLRKIKFNIRELLSDRRPNRFYDTKIGIIEYPVDNYGVFSLKKINNCEG